MTTPDVPLEKLVSVYLKMRTAIEEQEDAHKKAIASLKDEFEVVANKLLSVCQELGVDSLKTSVGTVSRRTATRYWTNDWESMYRFIQEHDAPYLLEQRLHNSNVRTFLEDNPDVMPVGLQADHKHTIQVRRPSAK